MTFEGPNGMMAKVCQRTESVTVMIETRFGHLIVEKVFALGGTKNLVHEFIQYGGMRVI
jgi:hypothetical protein